MDDDRLGIHLRLPPEIHERIRVRARSQQRSMAYVATEALGPGLDALESRDARIAALIDGEAPQ